tara:strand:- start:181 stop:1380 length:1200 start_codon:yes stop_codon:yes gene_type:complete
MKRINIVDNFMDELLFLLNTDLNKGNYLGITPLHLLFTHNLIENDKIFNKVKKQKLDLSKKDFLNRNIFTIVEKSKSEKQKKLMKNLYIFNNKIKIHDTNINIVFDNILEKNQNYGLFKGSVLNYAVAINYLQKKYKDLHIHKHYSENDIFLYNINNFPITNLERNIMFDINYFSIFFPKMNSNFIRWIDKKRYYIHPSVYNLDKTYKYYVFNIKIIGKQFCHANILIYNNENKKAYRFEPYGLSNLSIDEDDYGYGLDDKMKDMLERNFGKIKYYSPNDFLSKFRFQLSNDENNGYKFTDTDPGGYCVAWCFWFIDFYMSNPDNIISAIEIFMDRNVLINNFKKLDYKSENYYLDYIRSYSHLIMKERVKLFKKLNINENPYLENYDKEIYDKINEYI